MTKDDYITDANMSITCSIYSAWEAIPEYKRPALCSAIKSVVLNFCKDINNDHAFKSIYQASKAVDSCKKAYQLQTNKILTFHRENYL